MHTLSLSKFPFLKGQLTTRVGGFVLNHSFMILGLVVTATATVIAGGVIKFIF